MREYSTEAVVLDKESIGDLDALVSLYTPEHGKVVARAKSVRKITSKLASSLEIANIITARILESENHQIVDAFSLSRGEQWRESLDSLRELVDFLTCVKEITSEGESEIRLWETIQGIFASRPHSLKPYYRNLLASVGFDPRHARCEGCKNQKPDYFIPRDSIFICKRCFKPGVSARETYAVTLHPYE